MKIGFTGTQRGMTPAQQYEVAHLLTSEDEFHHGDCVGADEQAHGLALILNIPIVRHLPWDEKKRAFCEGGEEVKPKPYLLRNHDIVDATDMLIATPAGPETVRSGTWSTIRYASKVGKPVLVVMPDGSAG